MKSKVIELDDASVARIVSRGTGLQLTIHQEDIACEETGLYVPAKSITVTSRDSLRKLKDLLNSFEI